MSNSVGFNFNQDFLDPQTQSNQSSFISGSDFRNVNAPSFNVGGDFGPVGGSKDGIQQPTSFQNFATGAQIATGLYGAYLGKKQLDLSKQQFAFQKDFAEKNYENQSRAYNERLRERYLTSLAYSSPNLSQEQRIAEADRMVQERGVGNQQDQANG